MAAERDEDSGEEEGWGGLRSGVREVGPKRRVTSLTAVFVLFKSQAKTEQQGSHHREHKTQRAREGLPTSGRKLHANQPCSW